VIGKKVKYITQQHIGDEVKLDETRNEGLVDVNENKGEKRGGNTQGMERGNHVHRYWFGFLT